MKVSELKKILASMLIVDDEQSIRKLLRYCPRGHVLYRPKAENGKGAMANS